VLRRDCLASYNVFNEVSHLWRYGAWGGVLGIDWTQAQSYLFLIQKSPQPETIKDLRIIERAVCKVLNEK
jgi:hypothetical protein